MSGRSVGHRQVGVSMHAADGLDARGAGLANVPARVLVRHRRRRRRAASDTLPGSARVCPTAVWSPSSGLRTPRPRTRHACMRALL